jgi:oligopeptide transport system substrate-binding protein
LKKFCDVTFFGRKKMRFMFLKNLIAVCLLVFCGSCSQGSPKGQASEKLRFYVNPEPVSLDPRTGWTFTSQLIIYQLFEGLTRFGTKGEPQPAIAQAIDISDDRTTYTFHLRPTKWSNGDDLTAMDFEYAWKTSLHSSIASANADSFFSIKNAQKAHRNECSLDDVGIRTLDKETLQVTLEHPAPYFLEWTSSPPYAPVHRPTDERDEHWARHAFPTYVCNGPYLLKDYRQGSHIVLEKNPLYWNTKDCAKTKTVKFLVLEDSLTAYNMFKAGDLDWYGAPFSIGMPFEIITALKNDGIFHSSPTGLTSRMDCCVTKPHLASPKIRKALACAINRNELVSHLLIGGDRPAASLVTESFSLQQTPKFEDGNAELARRLFEEGYTELGYTKETYPPLVLSTRPRSKAVAEVISEQLQKVLGIQVRLEVLDTKIFYKKRAASELELALEALSTGLRDPIYDLGWFKYPETGLTTTHWKCLAYQHLLDASDASVDETERREYLRQAEELLMTEMPAVPLVYEAEKYAKAPNIVGEELSPGTTIELKRLERVHIQ